MILKAFLSMLVFHCIAAFAEDASTKVARAPRLFHNLSASTNTLGKHECTLGIQVIGCGVTERWTLALSPWLLQDYNMANVASRLILKEYPNQDRYVLQVNYFKTWDVPSSYYGHGTQIYTYYQGHKMEALWLMGVRSFHVTPNYVLHLNFHTNYYMDDDFPFSLRRPIPGRSPWQLNLTVLNEIDLIDGWGAMIEAGFLDFIQPINYVHLGSSMGYSAKTWSFHAGFSITSSFHAFFKPGSRRDNAVESPRSYQQNLSKDEARNDYALHQEFSLQYYF